MLTLRRIVAGGRVLNSDAATLASFGILDDNKQPLTMSKHVMVVAPPGVRVSTQSVRSVW